MDGSQVRWHALVREGGILKHGITLPGLFIGHTEAGDKGMEVFPFQELAKLNFSFGLTLCPGNRAGVVRVIIGNRA